MTIAATDFRKQFRAFSDQGSYPDDTIDFYLGLGYNFLSGSSTAGANRWTDYLDYGVALFTAHHLALDARNNATVAAGGIPGEVKGPSTAKAVDKVSQGYDTKAVTFENEPFWNQTSFGIRLMELARLVGAGGIQIGACDIGIANPFGPFGLNL